MTDSDQQRDTVVYVDFTDQWMEIVMFAAMAESEAIEPSYKEAKRYADWSKWHEAIKLEPKTLIEAGTWEIVPQLANHNVIGSKWVLRIKKKSGGVIDKYKAQFVGKGFT